LVAHCTATVGNGADRRRRRLGRGSAGIRPVGNRAAKAADWPTHVPLTSVRRLAYSTTSCKPVSANRANTAASWAAALAWASDGGDYVDRLGAQPLERVRGLGVVAGCEQGPHGHAHRCPAGHQQTTASRREPASGLCGWSSGIPSPAGQGLESAQPVGCQGSGRSDPAAHRVLLRIMVPVPYMEVYGPTEYLPEEKQMERLKREVGEQTPEGPNRPNLGRPARRAPERRRRPPNGSHPGP
jgi:hypothetical protein